MKASKQTDPSLLSTQEGITACTLTIQTLKSALMKQTAKNGLQDSLSPQSFIRISRKDDET